MIRVVADASVAIKWLLPGKHDERDWKNALGLLRDVRAEQIHLVEPPHWLAEVAAVVTRLSPATALEDVSDLYAMNIPIVETAHVYSAACKLSRELDQVARIGLGHIHQACVLPRSPRRMSARVSWSSSFWT